MVNCRFSCLFSVHFSVVIHKFTFHSSVKKRNKRSDICTVHVYYFPTACHNLGSCDHNFTIYSFKDCSVHNQITNQLQSFDFPALLIILEHAASKFYHTV